MENLLSVTELASQLNLNPETVRRLTRSGELPHVKVGKSIRYRLSEVARGAPSSNFDPRAYIEGLIHTLRNPPYLALKDLVADIRFKEAHAVGATAALRDSGLISSMECAAWRALISAGAKYAINSTQEKAR